jgi:hypothetical protein
MIARARLASFRCELRAIPQILEIPVLPFRSISFLLVLFVSVATAVFAQPEILSPDTVIADPARDAAWSPLFQQLATPKNRVSHFDEHRYFPFRDKPIELTGEVRIIPSRGLSLNYLTPKHQMIIVDNAGVLMRDDRGRQRAAPADSRAQAATSALFNIFRFDLAALARQFVVHGTRSGQRWTLGFVPRDAALAGLLGTVTVEGEEAHLNRIDLTRSDKQRVEILIKDTIDDVIFSDEVVKRFFR